MKTNNVLRLPALEIRQGKSRLIYNFGVDGKMLSRFTSIARISPTTGRRFAGISDQKCYRTSHRFANTWSPTNRCYRTQWSSHSTNA